MTKLMKNRICARKCRKKKKNYLKDLEVEIKDLREKLNKYKSIQMNEMRLEYYIDNVKFFIKFFISFVTKKKKLKIKYLKKKMMSYL